MSSISLLRIKSSVVFIEYTMSNPCTIPSNSEAKTLRVILLHLTETQYMILALFLAFAATKRALICDKRSLLLAKAASVKTRSCKVFLSSYINYKPLEEFSICYYKRLFSAYISFK
jgi:hypothetical protein